MSVMRAEEEEDDGYAKQELLGWRILIPIVDLLPHIEVIVGTGVEFKRNAAHPVEH